MQNWVSIMINNNLNFLSTRKESLFFSRHRLYLNRLSYIAPSRFLLVRASLPTKQEKPSQTKQMKFEKVQCKFLIKRVTVSRKSGFCYLYPTTIDNFGCFQNNIKLLPIYASVTNSLFLSRRSENVWEAWHSNVTSHILRVSQVSVP